MRMPPNQFLSDVANDVVDIESFGFARDLSVHDCQKQKVAKFLLKMRVVLRAGGFSHFIRFLDRCRQQRLVRLLAIPWATAGRPKLRDDLAQLRKVVSGSLMVDSRRHPAFLSTLN